MKIIVTGCSGFIGTHLVNKLLKDGHEVVGIDHKGIPVKHKNFEFIGCSLDMNVNIDSIFAEQDAIIHLAASKSVPCSIIDPDSFFYNNAISTLVMLDFAHRLDVKKFIFASSSSVYGDDEYTVKYEKFIGNPLSPYAASKRMCELMINQYQMHYGIDCYNLRFFNVYGPGQKGNVFDLFQKQDKLEVYGDCNRDFTHVSDIVNGIICCLDSDNPGTYNLGTGVSKSVKDIAQKYDKPTTYLPARACDIKDSCACIKEAKRCLGYNPKHMDINWEGIR